LIRSRTLPRSILAVARAALAPATRYIGIGIDSETVVSATTARTTARTICRSAELERFGHAPLLLTAVFSAKESLYKCLCPLVRRPFDFHDAEIDVLDLSNGRFLIRLVQDLEEHYLSGWRAEGRVALDGTFAHTGIALVSPGKTGP
jgi:enterobactin synthetase component D